MITTYKHKHKKPGTYALFQVHLQHFRKQIDFKKGEW